MKWKLNFHDGSLASISKLKPVFRKTRFVLIFPRLDYGKREARQARYISYSSQKNKIWHFNKSIKDYFLH